MRFISSFRISYQHHQEEHHHHRRQLPSSRSQALGMKVAAAAPATPFRGPVTPRNSPIGFSLPARRFSRLGYTVRWCRRYPLSYSQWKSCEILSALANSNFPPLRSSRSQSRANFTEITETLSGGLSRIRYMTWNVFALLPTAKETGRASHRGQRREEKIMARAYRHLIQPTYLFRLCY